ncbi:MAG: hypothetical protein KDC44_08525 [Phaeodactylibacter sp.]|nr:hypothetical protein [Phaeodactylibacter sp.]
MDKLEQFIAQNREAFDDGMPGLKVWASVERELDQGKPNRTIIVRYLKVAAAAVFLLMAGGVAGSYVFHQQNVPTSLADISPEYAEVESYYNQQVNQKLNQLVAYRHVDVVEADLKQLDQIMQDLWKELQEAPAGTEEQIIEAMIDNYKVKLEILERVLEKVQSTNQNALNPEQNEVSI